jgi:hypothetical protein
VGDPATGVVVGAGGLAAGFDERGDELVEGLVEF